MGDPGLRVGQRCVSGVGLRERLVGCESEGGGRYMMRGFGLAERRKEKEKMRYTWFALVRYILSALFFAEYCHLLLNRTQKTCSLCQTF